MPDSEPHHEGISMTEPTTPPIGFKGASHEGFILLTSLLAVCNIIFLLFPAFYPDATSVALVIDIFLSVVFFADFLYRLLTTESKVYYVIRDGGWADLLSSIPFPGMKIFRLFRIGRVVLLMRRFGIRRLKYDFSEERASGALYFVIFFIIALIEVCSIWVLHAERSAADANIRTAGDALWWAYVTTTTVGYGDQYPVTPRGRIVGVFLMAAGVSIFGTLAGFLSNKLIAPRRNRDRHPSTKPDTGTNSAEIRELMEQQEKMYSQILSRLEKIEEEVRKQGKDPER
jgi:voltage-gated potassium channel